MKNFNDTIGNRTRDLPACSAVPQPTAPPRAPLHCNGNINPLTPKDPYSGCTAPLTSKHCILNIYSTNIGTEYFKHGIYCPFFLSSKCSLFHNSNVFGSCFIHILYTECAKIKKKNNSSAKRLKEKRKHLTLPHWFHTAHTKKTDIFIR